MRLRKNSRSLLLKELFFFCMPQHQKLLSLLLCCVLFMSCGKKSNPVAPRTIGPEAVKKFQAVPRPEGIILVWYPSAKNTDDTPLLDLESFKIYREEVRFVDWCQNCPRNFVKLFEYAYKGPRGKVPGRELLYYIDRAVMPGHTYSYKIHCTNVRGTLGAPSPVVTVFWDIPSAPPHTLRAERRGKYVILSWDSPETLEDGRPIEDSAGFNVYRTLEQGVYESLPLNTEPVTDTIFEDIPDTYDQTYYYTVRSVRKVYASFIESAPSPETKVAYADITAPSAPQGLTVISTREGVLLKWVAKAEKDVAGYNMYRKSPGEADFLRINREVIQDASWVDTTAHTGRTYRYAVTAVDASATRNESPFSASVRITHLPQ